MLIRAQFAISLGCLGLLSCGRLVVDRPTEPSASRTPQVLSVLVSPSSASVPVGGTLRLSAVVAAEDGATAGVRWSSNDSLVASVSPEGIVLARAVSSGVRVCATSSADATKAGCAHVTVNAAVAWEQVSVVPSEATLLVGESVNLYASAPREPASATTFIWASADTSRVSVAGDGRVTARAATPGTAVCARLSTHPDRFACVNVIVR
jgi:uncharacterized protein YjdB